MLKHLIYLKDWMYDFAKLTAAYNLLLKELRLNIWNAFINLWKLDLQIKLLTFWLSELNSINLWPIAPIVLQSFSPGCGFRMIFLNGEFIIVVIWLNRQCYLVIHPALSSHPQKQPLKVPRHNALPTKVISLYNRWKSGGVT